jgi:hypothetical protein
MQLVPLEKTQFVDSSGVPYSGAKLYIYLSGTNTPVPTYGDKLGKLVYSIYPITLDSQGRTNVFVSTNYEYRIVLKDPLDRIILFRGEGFTGGSANNSTNSNAPPPPPPPAPSPGTSAENFVSLINSSSSVAKKGTPVYSNGTTFGIAIANNNTVKRLVGLVAATITPGSSGLVQLNGVMNFTQAEWLAVTGQTGGIGNTNYWVSATQAGQLTNIPVQQTDTEVWSLNVGYGVDNLNFKIEIQPSVKL